jgi:peptidoglycan biosynthesis protein MviN/MurJ (putative lipid II flippase)
VLSILLARPLGVAGVALATAVPNVIFAVLLIRVVCRELGVSGRRYLAYVVWKPLVGSLPVLGAVALSTLAWDAATFGGLLLAGIVLTIVFAGTWLLFVYNDDAFVSVPRLSILRPFRAS